MLAPGAGQAIGRISDPNPHATLVAVIGVIDEPLLEFPQILLGIHRAIAVVIGIDRDGGFSVADRRHPYRGVGAGLSLGVRGTVGSVLAAQGEPGQNLRGQLVARVQRITPVIGLIIGGRAAARIRRRERIKVAATRVIEPHRRARQYRVGVAASRRDRERARGLGGGTNPAFPVDGDLACIGIVKKYSRVKRG